MLLDKSKCAKNCAGGFEGEECIQDYNDKDASFIRLRNKIFQTRTNRLPEVKKTHC